MTLTYWTNQKASEKAENDAQNASQNEVLAAKVSPNAKQPSEVEQSVQ